MPDDAPWFATLSPEEQAHVTAKGWHTKPAGEAALDAVRSHYQAEKFIGVSPDQLLRVPKDTADPNYQAAYDRIVSLGVPKEPSEYKFDGIKFADGTDVPASEQDFVRQIAAQYKLPVAAARGLAEALVKRADEFAATEVQESTLTRDANATALRQRWGGEFEQKSWSATRALEAAGLPAALIQGIANLPRDQYLEAMDACVALGSKLGEAAMLRGGGCTIRDTTASLTPAEAQERLSNYTQNDAAWRAKFAAGDTATVSEWKKLTEIIASGRVPRS